MTVDFFSTEENTSYYSSVHHQPTLYASLGIVCILLCILVLIDVRCISSLVYY